MLPTSGLMSKSSISRYCSPSRSFTCPDIFQVVVTSAGNGITLHHDLGEANVDGQVHELVGGGGPNVQNLCLSHAVRFGVLDVHGGRHLVALVVDKLHDMSSETCN
uniref:Uncharacterized protein n=1 Tax=Anopheles melas TaxID=34690 RepID=A0A182THT1_9DIPT